MSERAKETKNKKTEESKEISRRQFLTGSTEGAVSFGVFGHPVAQFLATIASNLDSTGQHQEQNKRMLEQAKRSQKKETSKSQV